MYTFRLDEIEIPGITESAVRKKAQGIERQLVFFGRIGANRLGELMSNQRTTTCSEHKTPGTALHRDGVQDPATRGSIHWGTGFPLVSGPANGVTISPMR